MFLGNEVMLNILQVRDYMIFDFFWFLFFMLVIDVIVVLFVQGFVGVLVVECGCLVGMFFELDGLKGVLDVGYYQIGIGQVVDYMSWEVNCFDCNVIVQEVVEMFLCYYCCCLLVVDGYWFVGQLSCCDILCVVSVKVERVLLDDIIN